MIYIISEYLSLFVTSFLASTILPLGSEGLLAFLVHKGLNIYLLILTATIGNYLGACVNYYIGIMGSHGILHKFLKINKKDEERSKGLFKKYGAPILLLSWIPIIGDPLTLFAGIMKLNFKIFSIFVFIGKLIRYIGVYFIVSSPPIFPFP